MKGHIDRDCPVCGITYKADLDRLKFGRQTTCSRSCSYRLRGDKLSRQQAVTCSTCGAQFTRTLTQIKSKHPGVYCSRACHYAGRALGLTARVVTTAYTRTAGPRTAEQTAKQVAARRAGKGYQHSDDTRARLREATARRIAEGMIPAVSGLENEVAEMLTDAGVTYRRQIAIRGHHGRYIAVADFVLADGRVFEVNGTFWHADPRFYPDGPIFPAQQRTADRWDRKVAALNDLGISLSVLWEHDFRENPAQALAVALAGV